MKKKIASVLIAFGLLGAATAEQALANAVEMGSYSITRITSNDHVHDVLPSINVESTIVWQRQVPCAEGETPCYNDYEIFMYSTASGVVRITDNNHEDYFPEINETGTIVWMSRLNANDDWEIWRKDSGSSDPVQMTNNELDDKYPQISANGNIVWNTFDGTDWEISYSMPQDTTQDLWSSNEIMYVAMASGSSGGTNYTVTDNDQDDYLTSGYLDYFGGEFDYTRPYKDNSPRMSPDGKIAWMAYDGHDFEIWNYDPATETPLQVTTNNVDDRYPQINAAGDMVWEKFDGNDYGIAYRERNSGQESYISIDETNGNVWDDVHPKLNENGDVAWQQFDGNDWEIGRYSASSGQSELITDDTFDHLYHTINNKGDIAWLTWAPGEYIDEPFILNLYNNTTNEVSEITSFMSMFPYPRLNDNREVTWWESQWQGYDIAIAKPNNPFHIRFLPNRLNKKSKRRWVKAVIELPATVDANNIDVTTLYVKQVNGMNIDEPIFVAGHTEIYDFNGDGIDDIFIWFQSEDLLEQLPVGTSELVVVGKFWESTSFYGKGLVKVKGRRDRKKTHNDKKGKREKKEKHKRDKERDHD